MNEDNFETKHEDEENEKWDFEDYAYTIALVLFLAVMFLPNILGGLFYDGYFGDGISESVNQMTDSLAEMLRYERGIDPTDLRQWIPFSWMFFVLAYMVVAIKDVIDAKTGAEGTEGKLLKYLDEALYAVVTVSILFRAIISGDWSGSWLAGPITWILFVFIGMLIKTPEEKEKSPILRDTGLLLIFALGIIIEAWSRTWVAFPVAWILICAIKAFGLIRQKHFTDDNIEDIFYYMLTVILISMGLIWSIWISSWTALPIVLVLSAVVNKVRQLRRS